MYLRTKPKIHYIIIINMPKSSKSNKSESGCVGFLYRGLVKTNHIRVFSHESSDLETIYNELTPLYGDDIQMKYVLVDAPEDFLEKFMDKLTSENEKARLGVSYCFNCQTSAASNFLKEVTDTKAAKNYPVTKKGKKDEDEDEDEKEEKEEKDSDNEDEKKKSKSDKKKGKSDKKKAKDESEDEDKNSESEQEDEKPKKKSKDSKESKESKESKKSKSDKKAKESEDEKEESENDDDDDEDSGKKLKKKTDKGKGKSKSK
jgi:hypothetical protein